MKLQAIDKFEYRYEPLYSSIESSINILNILGKDGWELFSLKTPKSTGEQYKALLKRRITEYDNTEE